MPWATSPPKTWCIWFNGMGVETGIDLAGLVTGAKWLEGQLDKPMPAMIGKAEPVYTRSQLRVD